MGTLQSKTAILPQYPQILTTNRWDSDFFDQFSSFKNSLYKNDDDFIDERIEDLKLFWGPDAFFSHNNRWKAVLALDHYSKPIGRYLLSFKPNNISNCIYLGYFEVVSAPEAQKFLFDRINNDLMTFKREFPELNEVVGPINGTVFNGSRFRKPTTNARFLFDPVHKDYYEALWTKFGFSAKKTWETFILPLEAENNHYTRLLEHPKVSQLAENESMTCLTKLNSQRFHSDIFKITTSAYKFSGTNDEIDLFTFQKLAQRMTPILAPGFSALITDDGRPDGFSISLYDIQHDIRWFNRKSRKLSPLKLVLKVILLLRIWLLPHPVLALYVAKRPDSKIKWLFAKLMTAARPFIKSSRMPYMISAFNANDSGSRASLPLEKMLHSTHFIMSKSI